MRGLSILSAAALLLAAPAAAQTTAPAPAPASEWRPLDPANTLLIETTKGRIVVEMRPEIAPLTVARVKALTRQGYYNGALFYRVIQGFMAQTGDKGRKTYRSALPNLRGEFTFALTRETPYASVGATPAGDVGFVGSMPVMVAPAAGQVADQPPTAGRGHVLYCPGVAAFAHPDGQPNGGNSQFFLMRGVATNLEKGFAAWGRVIDGQPVVEAIRNGNPPTNPDKMTRVRVMADVPSTERPKLEVADLKGPVLAAAMQEAMAAKGAQFSMCDIKVATRTTP